jgi:hypothetical protein
MRVSNCLTNPESILSVIKDNNWKTDTRINGDILGYSCFFYAPDPEYYEIHEAMMKAAEIYLSNSNRDISDYEQRYDIYKVFKWNTPMDSMSDHTDTWEQDSEQVTPDISLVMYFTNDYDGGELKIDGSEIKPDSGDIVVFDSDTLHGVNEVLGGRRITTQLFLFKKDEQDGIR